MDNLKYFLQSLVILILFLIFKILGIKYSSIISGKIFAFIGPIFRSNKISISNLSKAFPQMAEIKKKHLR